MRGGGKRWVMYLNKNKNENINIHTKTQRCAPFLWYIKVKSERWKCIKNVLRLCSVISRLNALQISSTKTKRQWNKDSLTKELSEKNCRKVLRQLFCIQEINVRRKLQVVKCSYYKYRNMFSICHAIAGLINIGANSKRLGLW